MSFKKKKKKKTGFHFLITMSSRALKRLQKDQLLAVNDNDSEEEEIEQKPVKKFNPFDLVNKKRR